MGGWNNVNAGGGAGAGLATEATLLLVQAAVDSIETILTGNVRTHVTVRTSALGTVPVGTIRGSVLNVGDANGSWNGIALDAGVGVPFGTMGEGDTYAVIPYDASGTTFIVEYSI